MANDMMALYSGLSALDRNARLTAGSTLLDALHRFQELHESPKDAEDDNEEDEDTINEDEDDDVQVVTSAETAQKVLAPDVVYALKRLTRGLASSRENARQGFASVLTDLLAFVQSKIKTSYLLALLDKSTDTSGTKGEEERDILIGKLFGYLTLIRSGVFDKRRFGSDEPMTTIKDVESVIDGAIKVASKKSYLLETGYLTVVSLLSGIAGSSAPAESEKGKSSKKSSKKSAKSTVDQELMAEIITLFLNKVAPIAESPDSDYTTDLIQLWVGIATQNLFIKLGLKYSSGSIDFQSHFPDFKESKLLLSTGNIKTLVGILKSASTTSPHHLHAVWEVVFEGIALNAAQAKDSEIHTLSPIVSISEMWPELCDVLFQSTLERKDMGFSLFEKLLTVVSPNDATTLLDNHFLRTLLNHLGNKESNLNGHAIKLSKKIATVCDTNKKLGLPIAIQLMTVKGYRDFDAKTKTKTIQTIMQSLDEESLAQYVRHLINIFYHPEMQKKILEDESTPESTADIPKRAQLKAADDSVQEYTQTRIWCVEQIMSLLRNPNVPKHQSWIELAAQFIAIHSLFMFNHDHKSIEIVNEQDEDDQPAQKRSKKSKKGDSTVTKKSSNVNYKKIASATGMNEKDVELLFTQPKDEINARVQGLTKQRLPIMQGHLDSMVLATETKEETVSKRRNVNTGMRTDGSSWVKFVLEFINQLRTTHEIRVFLHLKAPLDEESLDSIKHGETIITNINKEIAKLNKSKKQDGLVERKKQFVAFESLVYHTMLILFSDPQEVGNTLSELEECFSRFFTQKKVTKKGSKKGQDEEEQDDENDVKPIEVIMDILIGFMSKPSSLLRGLATNFLSCFAKDVTPRALKLAIDVIVADEANDDSEDAMFVGTNGQSSMGALEDSDEDEDDSMMVETANNSNDEKDVEDDDDEDDDEKEDEDDDEEEEQNDDEKVDPEFYNKVKLALGKAAVNDDAEESEPDLSDSELEGNDMYEEGLAKVFRERKAIKQEEKETKIQIQHLKLRVVDLLTTFIRNAPESPLQLELCLPLVKLLLRISKNNKNLDLHQRISSFVGKTLTRFNSNIPVLTTRAEVIRSIEVLTELHTLLAHSPDLTFSKLTSKLALFVASVIRKTALANVKGLGQLKASDYPELKEILVAQAAASAGAESDDEEDDDEEEETQGKNKNKGNKKDAKKSKKEEDKPKATVSADKASIEAKQWVETISEKIYGKTKKGELNIGDFNVCIIVYARTIHDMISRRRSKVKAYVYDDLLSRYVDYAWKVLIAAGLNDQKFIIKGQNNEEDTLTLKEFDMATVLRLVGDTMKRSSTLSQEEKDLVKTQFSEFGKNEIPSILKLIKKSKNRKIVTKSMNKVTF